MAAAPSFAVGERVTLHGLSTAVLNGASGRVEAASAETSARGRVAVRVTGPAAAVAAHASAALKPENLRACTPDELARLYVRDLWARLQDELRAASLALQDEADDDASADASSAGALARLRVVVAQADEALKFLENMGNALPRSTDGTERDGLIALYAFLLATASANVAAVCAMRGDALGQLAALERSFSRALQRGFMPVASAQYGMAGLVQECLLRYGEALRVAGRSAEAVKPLKLAARVAGAEEDEATEAQAQGTLSSVLLGLSEYEPAEQAGEREVALLECAVPEAAPVALARARASLANVKHARAAAAAGTPQSDAFAEQAAALAEEAFAAVPARVQRGSIEAAHWAEVACGVCTLRGHLARLRGDLEAAAAQYEAALDAVASSAAGGRNALPTDAAVAPHALLERVHAELAAAARADGSAEAARLHGGKAVTHRLALFGLLGKALPDECSVCTEALHADDAASDVAMLTCMHVFHTKCVNEWLEKQLQGTCPLCRSWSVVAEREHVEAYRQQVEAERQCADVTPC